MAVRDMIVSHLHRFVFVAVPKTGTHSVRQALRDQLGTEDVEQVGLFVNRRFPWPDLAAVSHGHLSLRQIRPHLGESAFGEYLKFAFVRNPFDRFISYCAFMLRGSSAFETRPREVMRHFLFRDPPDQHVLFQPQAWLLTDADGVAPLTDMIGHVEDMQASYDAICARIGLSSRRLARVNDSRHADYRRYYDPALADAVAARYARDLDIFRYTFDGRR